MRVLENLIEYIFDRNSCLIPSYLLIDELQKSLDSKKPSHWVLKVFNFKILFFLEIIIFTFDF